MLLSSADAQRAAGRPAPATPQRDGAAGSNVRQLDEKSRRLEAQLERGRRLTEEVDAGADSLQHKVVRRRAGRGG